MRRSTQTGGSSGLSSSRHRKARLHRAAIEALETRQYLSVTITGIQQVDEFNYQGELTRIHVDAEDDSYPPILTVDIDWGDGATSHLERGVDFDSFVYPDDDSIFGHTYNDNTQDSYSYPAYPISVTVTDGASDYDTQGTSVIVYNDIPIAWATNSGPVNEGSPVTINAFGSDGDTGLHYDIADDPDDLATSYGDAGTSTTANLTFGESGYQTACIRVFDKDGAYADATTVVNIVNVAPYATLTFGDPDSSGHVQVSLADPTDPSDADASAGFRYSFSTNYNSLASSYSAADSLPSATFTESQLANGATVYARIFDQDGGYRNYSEGTTDMSAAPAGPNQINLTWTDDLDHEAGWRVQQSTDGTTFTNLIDLSANTNHYEVTGLTEGTRRWYRVRAFSETGLPDQSIYSPKMAATTPLNAPSNLSADLQEDGSVTLSWLDHSNVETGFKIYRSTDGGSFSLYHTITASHSGSNSVEYTATDLDASSTYAFYVTAYNSSAESIPSQMVAPSLNTSDRATIMGPAAAETGDTVRFWLPDEAEGSTRLWSAKFNDRSIASGDGNEFSFLPQEVGQYTIELTTIAADHSVTSVSQPLDVHAPSARTIEIKAPKTAEEGRGVGFIANVNLKDPVFAGLDLATEVTYVWTIQHGTSSPTTLASHLSTAVYTLGATGAYTVQCTVKTIHHGVEVAVFKGSASFTAITAPESSTHIRTVGTLDTEIEEDFLADMDAVELPNGQIINLVGEPSNYDQNKFAFLERLNPDLSLDTTWGEGGRVYLTLPETPVDQREFVGFQQGSRLTLALLANGKIVVGGAIQQLYGFGTPTLPSIKLGWYVERFNADGTIDSSFGSGGRTILKSQSLFRLSDMLIQPDGRILLAGEGRSFGGVAVTDSSYPDDEWQIGEEFDARRALALARFNSDGSVDDGTGSDSTPADEFGEGGISIIEAIDDAYTNAGNHPSDLITDELLYSIAIQPDGQSFRIIGGGFGTRDGNDPNSNPPSYLTTEEDRHAYAEAVGILIRLDRNGTPDSSFGDDGIILSAAQSALSAKDSIIRKVAITSDSSIVAIGNAGQISVVNIDGSLVFGPNEAGYYPTTQGFVAKYSPDGEIDTDFGDAGFVNPVSETLSSTLYGGFVDSRDRIVVVGDESPYDNDKGTGNGIIARLKADGSKDSFPTLLSTDGQAILDDGTNDSDHQYPVIADAFLSKFNGDVVGWGANFNSDDSARFANIVRLTPDDPGVVGLSAALRQDGGVDLHWTDGGKGEDGYTVERKLTTGGSTSWALLGVTGPDATTFSDLLAAPNTSYDYRVTAYFGTNSSGVPQSVGNSMTATIVTRPTQTRHVIDEVLKIELDGTSVTSTTLLEPGKTYQLRASGAFYLGSNYAHPALRADAEYGFWDPLPLNNSPEINNADYGIKFGTKPELGHGQSMGPFWGPPSADGIYSISYTAPAGTPAPLTFFFNDDFYNDNTYYTDSTYTTRWFPQFGNLQVEIYREIPGSPSQLQSSADDSARAITLKWSNPAPDASQVTVERKLAGGSYSIIATLPGSASTFSDNDVEINKSYIYRVQIGNLYSESDYSNETQSLVKNLPPTIEKPEPQFVPIGEEFQYQVEASDPEDGSTGLTYSLLNPLTGMEISDSGFIHGWTPPPVDVLHPDFYFLTVHVEDSNGNSFEQRVPIQRTPPSADIPSISTASATQSGSKQVSLTASAQKHGTDDGLIYTWSVVKSPRGFKSPTFTNNGSHDASSTTATLYGAGEYVFRVKVSDGGDWPATKSTAAITIDQEPGTLSVGPTVTTASEGFSRQLGATMLDQFDHALTTQPTITWSILNSGEGSLSPTTGQSIQYTLNSSISTDKTVYVQASAYSGPGTKTRTVTLNLISHNEPPTIAPLGFTQPTSFSNLTLSALAHDPDGPDDDLTYFWECTVKPTIGGQVADDPIFDATNGTSAAQTIGVTCDDQFPFQYTFRVTVTDAEGASTSEIIPVTDSRDYMGVQLTSDVKASLPTSDTVHPLKIHLKTKLLDQFSQLFHSEDTPLYKWYVDGSWDTVAGHNGDQYDFVVPTTTGVHTVSVEATVGSTIKSSTITLSVVNSGSQFQILPGTGDRLLVDHDTPVNIRAFDLLGGSLTWYLRLRAADGTLTLLNSNSEQHDSPYQAAILKPAMLANGLYTLELTNSSSPTAPALAHEDIEIKSTVKLGTLNLPVTDLQVDLPGGGSISVTRVYDSSRANEKDDFGYGWKFLLTDTSAQTTSRPVLGGSHPLLNGDLIYVTLPDGGQRVFQFVPKPTNWNLSNAGGFYATYYPQFVSVDGSHSTLIVNGDLHTASSSRTLLTYDSVNSLFKTEAGDAYEFTSANIGSTYQVKSLDGTTYVVDTATGLVTTQTDPNGNQTVFNPSNGTTTSSGSGMHLKVTHGTGGDSDKVVSVSIVDGSGDPVTGIGSVSYTYNSGNLTAVTGQDSKTTHYGYLSGTHKLTTVTDSRGVNVLTAEYQTGTAELRRLTDASGNAVPISTGAFNGPGGGISQNVSDPVGGETELRYDDRGNVTREIKAVKDASGKKIGYLVTVKNYSYGNAESDVDSLIDTGVSLLNSLQSMTEFKPFFVTLADATHRYDVPDASTIIHRVDYSTDRNETAGLVTSEWTLDASGNHHITTTYSSYKLGKPQVVEDNFGNFTYFKYDDSGNLTWTANSLGEGTKYFYSNGTSYQYAGDGSATTLTAIPKGLLLETYRIQVTNPENEFDGNPSTTPTIDVSSTPISVNKYYTSTSTGAVSGMLQSTKDNTTGLTTSYTYTPSGQTSTVSRSWTGHSVTDSTTTYDSAGRVQTVTDANGKTTTTHYDSAGRVDYTIDAHTEKTWNTYDTRGNLIRTLYPDGTETRTVYDSMGRAAWTTDRYASTSHFDAELFAWVNDNSATANVTHTLYDSLGRVIGTERFKNALIQLQTDVTTSTDTVFKSVAPAINSLIIAGNKLSSTSTFYDEQGRSIETIDAAGLRTATVYCPNGQVQYTGILNSSAPDGGVISTVDHLTTIGFADINFASKTTYEYDNTGSVTDPLPTGAVRYDTVTDARDHATRTYKDALGRTIKTVYADDTSTQALFGVGMAAVSGHSVSGQTITGHQETTLDPLGHATDRFFDAAGRLTDVYLPAVADALNSNTSTRPHWHYTYDANGNELTQVDPKTHTTTFTYDEQGHQLSRTLPTLSGSNSTESWTYDDFGRMKNHEDFNGQTTAYVYDTVVGHGGRETDEYRFANDATVYNGSGVLQTGNAAERTNYSYDSLGRQSEVKEYTGSTLARDTTSIFDPVTGNLSQVASPEGTVNYEYDPETGRHTRTYTSSNDTRYAYDIQGRLHTVTTAKLSGSTVTSNNVTTYDYDPVGNLDSVTGANGTVDVYHYDDLNRLDHVTATNSGGHKLFEQEYTLRDDGSRDYVIEKRYDGSSSSPFSTTKIDWSYDDEGRLTGETRDEGNDSTQNGGDYTDVYSFDLAGNRITKTHDAVSNDETITSAYNDRDELTSADSTINAHDATYTYDDNGSTTSVMTNGTSTVKYLWDLRNRMTGYSANGDNDAADSGDINYTYDNNGNRVSRTVVGGSSTYYVIDANNPTGYAKAIEEKSSTTGSPVRSYILGMDVVAQSDATSGTLYLLHDGHGTTRALINTSGAVVERYDFDAFGNKIRYVNGSGTDLSGDPLTTWLMADGFRDFTTGLDHNGARDVAAWLGRFMTTDPGWGFISDPSSPTSLHRYNYGDGNPIMHLDPSGMFTLGEMLTACGIDVSFDGIKDFKDAVVQRGVNQSAEELLSAFSMDESNENAKMSRAAEILWEVRLTQLGFKAVPLQESSIGTHGPDMIAVGFLHGKFHVIVGEVKGLSSPRGLSSLGEWSDGTVQMAARWVDTYASQIVDGFVNVIEGAIGSQLPPGIGQLAYDALSHFKIEYFLLRARRYSGNGWRLMGSELVHLGDKDVGIAGSQLPELESRWPSVGYAPDPEGF